MAHLLADPVSCFFRDGEGQLECHASNISGDDRNPMIPLKKFNPGFQKQLRQRLNSHRCLMRNSAAAQWFRGDESFNSKRLRHLHRPYGTDENRNAAD
jgi:hypothetical protein